MSSTDVLDGQTMLAYATASAGMHESHTLILKLSAIAGAGFKAVEIAWPDLESHAKAHHGCQGAEPTGEGDIEAMVRAGAEIGSFCHELGLQVLTLMPFSRFEGYDNPERRKANLSRARSWMRVMQALRCSTLQLGSSDDTNASGDLAVVTEDLRTLADEASAMNMRIAYEMWACGTHNNTWQHVINVCRAVDRPNFGVCLDTFQICAREYADVTSPNRLIARDAPQRLSDSLRALTRTLSEDEMLRSKVVYFQISDGSGKISPQDLISSAKEQDIPPLYAWSNSWRPLPYQDDIEERTSETSLGGYLPVVDVMAAVFESGWRGPLSYEVFYESEQSGDDTGIPERWTVAAMKAHALVVARLKERGIQL